MQNRDAKLKATTLSATSISFFGLPREIRDLIYDYYWMINPIPPLTFRPLPGYDLEIRYSVHQGTRMSNIQEDKNPRPPPLWLLASKQLLHEGIHQFLRN